MTQTNENVNITYHVDSKTALIYEAQFLAHSVLVRPASPALYKFIENISKEEFEDRFEEFSGDMDVVQAFATLGKLTPFTVETRH